MSQFQSEFALHARAILGLPVSTEMKSPGASAVIYGGVEAGALRFEGVEEALSVPGSDLRLFGKPEPSSSAAWAWRWRAEETRTRRVNAPNPPRQK
jgi:phosphoribosylglycinamide formyltransferase 2